MSRRRHPRGLRPDEQDLWRRVVEKAEPMHRRPDPIPEGLKPKPASPQPPRRPAPLDPFRIGEASPPARSGHDLAAPLPDRLAAAPLRMDRKAYGKMKRGKLPVEGRIDLHGMTLDQAHPRLVQFLSQAHGAGKRLVLVITGKGRPDDATGPMPRPRGVLRHQLPMWLAAPPLSALVLQVTPAHRSHGGSGAYYVYLRRGG